jgi:cyclopropane-fatty-acyl-phospholipid synthase|tara:strand:- start:2422 stop:3444 length:1023 start_codon:yes stop_codon:yes gene_type:complete
MWYNALLSRGLIPDFLLRRGVRSQGKQRLLMMEKSNPVKEYNEFLKEASSGDIAIHTDDANNQHYEVDSEFFQYCLGKNLKYSSCYWNEDTSSLDEAEENMLDLYCKRAEVKDGIDILDIGCGWGSLSLFLANKYPRSNITGVSNSPSQKHFIDNEASKMNLKNLKIITSDINDFDSSKQFDRIISIEMFEHTKNSKKLLDSINGWLKPNGSFFMHVFAHKDNPYYFDRNQNNAWMAKYFFTGGMMPNHNLFRDLKSKLDYQKSWMLSGTHYEKTSNAWLDNMDLNRTKILELFKVNSNNRIAKRKFHFWRLFFIACAEIFGYANGSEWCVSHHLFKKSD